MRFKSMFGIGLLLCSLVAGPHSAVDAHGGGLDSDGGHNCYVGSCAGTYHCHQSWGPGCGGGGSYSSNNDYYQLPILPAACVDISGGIFSDSEIARIQTALKSGGYRPGPIDGVYGRQTRSALNRFERKKKLILSRGNSIYLRSISLLGVAC